MISDSAYKYQQDLVKKLKGHIHEYKNKEWDTCPRCHKWSQQYLKAEICPFCQYSSQEETKRIDRQEKTIYDLLDSDLMKSLTDEQYKAIEDFVIDILVPQIERSNKNEIR
jgi:hypothetical protein